MGGDLRPRRPGRPQGDDGLASAVSTTAGLNPTSELILELYGLGAVAHARTAIGAAALPLDLPVVIAPEVEVDA